MIRLRAQTPFRIVHVLNVPGVQQGLLTDANRDGTITEEDRDGRGQWTLAAGALVPPRFVDLLATNSLGGLSPLLVTAPGTTDSMGMTMRLKKADAPTKEYLQLLDTNGCVVSFDNHGYYTLSNWPTADTVFLMASSQTRGVADDQPKEFTLQLELLGPNGQVISTETTRLRVAPVILPSECSPAEAVYSTCDTGVEGVRRLGCNGNVVQWTQDMVKFTKAQTERNANQDVFVALGHPRAGNLSGVLRYQERIAGVQWAVGGDGGNIMATPPLGPNAPYGKILIGTKRSDSIPYWVAQGVQPVVTDLNTDWLLVGHVDEVIMFVADKKVAFADPWTAADLLHGEVVAGRGTNTIWFGADENAMGMNRYKSILSVVVASDGNTYKTNELAAAMDASTTSVICSNMTFTSNDVLRVDNELMAVQSVNGTTATVVRAVGGRPAAAHTAGAIIYAYSEVMKYNLPIDPQNSAVKHIESVTNALSRALGSSFDSSHFIPLPVIFEYREHWYDDQGEDRGPGRVAGTANVVNCLPQWNDRLYYSQTGCDVFEMDIATKLQGLNPTPVDVWDNYHCKKGEIHCGTAARRSLSITPSWWQSVTNWGVNQ